MLGPNQWAAGPDAPAPIEGLEIRPLASDGLRVEIQVMTAGRASAWSEWASPGKFVGTRGRNLPLTGLRLQLVGDEADQFLLGSDALFLGSAIANRRGREIELSAPRAETRSWAFALKSVPSAEPAFVTRSPQREIRSRAFGSLEPLPGGNWSRSPAQWRE